jgi:hypothetical protein
MGKTIKDNSNCSIIEEPIYSGIWCNNCTNSSIKNNDIMAQYGLTIVVGGKYNNITDNVFRRYYNFNPIFTFDSSSNHNLFCDNIVTKTTPISTYSSGVTTCYFNSDNINAKILVSNSGTSNTITELCTGICSVNWYCSGNDILYLNSTCGIIYNNTCEYGCKSGIGGAECVGNMFYPTTTTTIYNVSYTNTVVNQTDLQEAGLSWLSPFFTPLFLIMIVEIIISSITAWISKQAITFPITMFILTIILDFYGIFGEFTLWVTALLCLITASVTAYLFRDVFHR